MVEWFTWLQVAIAVAAGIVCLIGALIGRTPNDVHFAALAIVELLLIVQLVVAVTAPAWGNPATGNIVEFYAYLISAILIPPIAALWALSERSRWSTVVLGVAALAIAVMVYRMLQVWSHSVA